MLWLELWCPEEDVELFIFTFIYSYLFLFKNIKAVPKAVPIYASGQSNDLWLAPRTGHWWFLQRRSASSPNYQLSAMQLTSAPSSCDDWTQTFTKLSGEQHRTVRPQRDFSILPIRLWLLRRPQPTDAVVTEWVCQEPPCR